VLGNALVRSVSCVSSAGLRRGMDSTNAAWSGVAAQHVILKPESQRLWIPSDGYMKSSSTHWSTNPALRDMTTAHRVPLVAMDVT